MMASATGFEALPMFQRGVSGCMIAPPIARCRFSKSRRDEILDELIGFEGFIVDFVEGRDMRVPFEQGGGRADESDGVRVEFPDRVDDRVIVRIEDILPVFGVAGDVDLR